jgi:hypothetical protein
LNGSDTILLLRRLLLAVILLGMSGTIAELYLLEHYEEPWQVVPLVALALGVALTLAVLVRPAPGTVRMLRLLFAAYLAVGVLGIWRHYVGNTEFELERHPDLAGLRLFWEALRGATPALAPGTMVQIGLFGMVALFRHPAASAARW